MSLVHYEVRTFDDFFSWLRAMNVQGGVVLDLDDVLFETYVDWFMRAENQFGNPGGERARDVFARGVYLQQYWNFPEAHAFFYRLSSDDDVYDAIPVIGEMVEAVKTLRHIKPIVGYCTARPITSYDRTRMRLLRLGLPDIPLVMRPTSVPLIDGSKWKALGLRHVYPFVDSVVDDSHKLPDYLGRAYEGTVCVYRATQIVTSCAGAVACPCADDVIKVFARR